MHFLPLLFLLTSQIQIDGLFQDWPDGVTHQEDAQFVYKRIVLEDVACLQQLPEQKVIQLGQYTIIFSPKDKGHGVACKLGDTSISSYEAGVIFAPTTASNSFEIRVNKPKLSLPTKTFCLETTGDFRVVSWNVQLGNVLNDRDRSARILNALKPDVILFQELDGDDTPEELSDFLTTSIGGSWLTSMSVVHGTERHHKLRSAISTKFNVTKEIDYGKLKAVLNTVVISKQPIQFLSLHLRCCGGPNSEAETQRQEEANVIRASIEQQQAPTWVIAGDWNLVGTNIPLQIVKADTLSIVHAFQPDGLVTATWSDVDSAFTPGRLDWMLYSPKTLSLTNCFVFDTFDLDEQSLLKYNLSSNDTAELSDHLPLVADFKVRK
ncbi:MAG TPA: endonuclease/exonuclease/phosphatase family protein [Phycisphaerales bacterium]|nr:endonuclease/exonuclease/phosphatase family protein [Phycisphaerales bacterium]HIB51320.1 endonuclease/exonuclease/phosphatase family protein [Phycisphaerales bacterium]HIN84242.1 endonuclease/exonuclease/phosphatase family protein [Phycisphaerales bacterium]HIO53460.1 endonuclease/exonuclease/phosphatase family protein [Phycisphaerales bacterium]